MQVLVIMLFGGFYVNSDRIPIGVRWIKYLSFLYWGYGALLVNEYRGRDFPCSYAEASNVGVSDHFSIQCVCMLASASKHGERWICASTVDGL